MKLPQKKKPGEQILATDWNLLIDAINARTPRPGSGLDLVAASGGFAYSARRQAAYQPGQAPFSVIAIEKNGTNYKVTMKEGWVIERQPEIDQHPAVRFHIPKVGGVALDTIPRPQLTMALGTTAFCRIKTDIKGKVSEQPTISAAAAGSGQDGQHYYPKDPDASGQTGDIYVKLFTLADDGSGGVAVKVYQQSDIEHWAQLWTGENVGSGSRVFKEHTESLNVYRFRSIKGINGLVATENSDQIDVSPTGANLNWEVYQTTFAHDVEGHLVATRGTAPEFTVYIRNGLVIGLVDPDDDPDDLRTIACDRNSV